jgi:hypothetical protein
MAATYPLLMTTKMMVVVLVVAAQSVAVPVLHPRHRPC